MDFSLSMQPKKPNWQLPAGVNRGTWDYICSEHIAQQYDAYFADSQLMRLDLEIVHRVLPRLDSANEETPPRVADLGCGTGRIARALLPLGYSLECVDLSPAMLRVAAAGIEAAHADRCHFHCANLVEVDRVLAPASIDLAVCLFSSLGMIRGRVHRRSCLAAVRRSLKPGGRLLVHVHNRYQSLFDPGGVRWLFGSWYRSRFLGRGEFGDRTYAYRGLPAMFLHIYSWWELRSDLAAAGLGQIEILPIAPSGAELLERWRPFAKWRAGGFFGLATRDEQS